MRALERATTLLRSATLVGALACACTSTTLPCLAQHAGEQAAPSEEAQAYVWTGKRGPIGRAPRTVVAVTSYGLGGEVVIERKDPNEHAVALRRELTEVLLLDRIEGKAGEAEARFDDLWVRAADAEDYPGRWDVLVELALARARTLERIGKIEAALTATQELLLPSSVAKALAAAPKEARYELVAADAATLAAEREALADARLLALRDRLAAQVRAVDAAVAAPAPSQGIEEAVREAVAARQHELVRELGARAAPVLEAMVLERLDHMPVPETSDPFVLLLRISELRGARVVLDTWERGGFLFKKRVLRGMREVGVLGNQGTWSFTLQPHESQVSTRPPRLMEPIWLDVLSLLATDPEVGRDSLDLISYVAWLDGLNEPLQEALIAALDGGDADTISDVLQALDYTRGRASVVPVLEHALDHDGPQVRSFAAERLALYPRNDALRARADHPDPLVRRAAARSLVGKVGQATYRMDETAYWSQDERSYLLARSVDERDVECLSRLLRDEDVEIRGLAVDALLQHPEQPVDGALVVRLTRDASPGVRRKMAYLGSGGPIDPGLLEALAADTDPGVLEALDTRLNDLGRTEEGGARIRPGTTPDGPTRLLWNDAYLGALLTRIANPARDFNVAYAVWAAGREPEGARAVARQALEERNEGALVDILWAMQQSANSEAALESAWLDLPPEDGQALLRALWALPDGRDAKRGVVSLFRSSWASEASRLLRPILSDESAPADLRLMAARFSAPFADASWREELVALLVEGQIDWAAGDSRGIRPGAELTQLAKALAPRAEQEALLRALVHTPEVPDRALLDAAWVLAGEVGVPPDLAHPTLERLARIADHEPGVRELQRAAIATLAASEEEPDLELFARMLASPSTKTVERTLQTMGRLRLRAHLSLLEEALRSAETRAAGPRAQRQVWAAQALAAFLDDEAVEVLLEGIGWSANEEARKACLSALETIRRYQDEKARWERRASEDERRDTAITELVPMLADGDANVRAQAARSLGALGAVERLPALVRMLKDPAPDVRTAAQHAIDVLTRSDG